LRCSARARFRERREFHQPDAVGEALEGVGGKLQAKSRLAAATRAGKGQQPHPGQQRFQFRQRLLPSDEARYLLRQVVGRGLQRTQRWKFLSEISVHDLVDMLGGRHILEAHPTEIAQGHRGRQDLSHAIHYGLRQQHLAPMGRAHDSRRTVDCAAEEIIVAALDHPPVQPATHVKGNAVGGRRIGQRLLQVNRRRERVERVIEGGMHAVAGHLHHCPAARLDRRAR